jgi:hypothetical protein
MARRIAPWLGIAALVIGYPLLAHYTNESAHSGNLGALVAIAPVVLIALALAWRSPRRFILLGVVALLCLARGLNGGVENHFGLVYRLQHVGIQLLLHHLRPLLIAGGNRLHAFRRASSPLTRSTKFTRTSGHVA